MGVRVASGVGAKSWGLGSMDPLLHLHLLAVQVWALVLKPSLSQGCHTEMALILQGCGEINELVFVRGLVGTWPYIVLVTCEIMWPSCSSGLTISAPLFFCS